MYHWQTLTAFSSQLWKRNSLLGTELRDTSFPALLCPRLVCSYSCLGTLILSTPSAVTLLQLSHLALSFTGIISTLWTFSSTTKVFYWSKELLIKVLYQDSWYNTIKLSVVNLNGFWRTFHTRKWQLQRLLLVLHSVVLIRITQQQAQWSAIGKVTVAILCSLQDGAVINVGSAHSLS